MEFSNIVLGLFLLVLGRKLFWLFVSIVGFLFGMGFAGLVFPDQPQWIQVLFALGAGFLGALLAVFAQRVAFAFAGFYGGFYFALILSESFGSGANNIVICTFVGVIGAVVATLIMDWVIIVFSCLVGAGAVVGASGLGQGMSVIVFLLLVLTGAFVQTRLLPQAKPYDGSKGQKKRRGVKTALDS
jgi:hypothetical protein